MKGQKEIFINKKSKIGVLMLHGFSSTPSQFKDLSAYLAKKRLNVSAPLIAGHGTTPEDFSKTSPEDWTKSAMEAYLKLKEISEKIFIVGNSFGSNLGFWIIKETNNEPAGVVALGAPIFLRFHNFIKFRLFTYGRFKKYYQKPKKFIKLDYTDMQDDDSYPVLPVKCLNELIYFLEKETLPNLKKIKIPILIGSASMDPVINPKSINCIFKNVGSSRKEIFWIDSKRHVIIGRHNEELFHKIHGFIKEIV
jgi:carboxylesterase